ncbi:Protein aurora borealis [Armadillidium vulgare]|nr:Protein aurora borealis [Armadillidium vulgare]
MENKNSPSTPRGRCSLYSKSENSSLNRKPLFQITNLCNNSPMLIRDKPVKHNNDIDESKENFSPSVSSQSKTSLHSFGKRVSSHSSKRIDVRVLSGKSFNTFKCKDHPSVSSSSKTSLHSFGKRVSSHSSKRNDVESFQESHSTPSSVKTSISTPHSSMNRYSGTPRSVNGQCTPKTFIPYNPFEPKADLLQLPIVSPSLFKEVVSPSEKEDTEFAWNIDNLAILYPVPIETPGSEMEVPLDPEYEKKAQEAIDKFFRNTVVVPSPWTDSSKSINLMSAIFSSSKRSQESSSASPALPCYSAEEKKETVAETKHSVSKVSASCQTELSLPPVLPKEVEAALAPYFTFTQDSMFQNNDDVVEDSSVLNTTTLRRKLLFSDEFSSVQQSFSSSSRTSSKVALEKSEVEGASSPSSIGPLPLDDDDVVLPWSVSMIRPSSCGSSHHPLSSPLQSSSGRKYSFSCDSINCSSGGKSHVIVTPMLSPHGVSPITPFPPKDLRSLPSPSDSQQTPRRRFLSSPKLSPILNCSDQMIQLKTPSPSSSFVTKLTSEISRSPLEYPRGKRGRNVSSKPGMSPLFVEQPCESKMSTRNYISIEISETSSASKDLLINECRSEGKFVQNLKEINSDSQGFTVSNVPKSEGKMSENPHFSSSPIKGSNACDSSCSPYQLDTNKFYDKEDNCSSKFSDSPPFSPISWKSDNAGSCDFNLKEDDKDENNHTNETMEDETEICASSSTIKVSPIRPCSKFQNEEKYNSTTVLDKGFGHPQEIIMSSVTYADSEFPNLYEGSTLEEISCGQDTGYQTGNSSQINPANHSSSLISSGGTITKEASQGFTLEKHIKTISKELLVENIQEYDDKIFRSTSSH